VRRRLVGNVVAASLFAVRLMLLGAALVADRVTRRA
jgi:hypothetical protein